MVDLCQRLEKHGVLSAEDRAAVERLGRNRRTFRRGEVIAPRGDPTGLLMLLHTGVVGSRVLGADGEQQLMRLHFAGDLMGASNLPVNASQDQLVGLREGALSDIGRDDLKALFHEAPNVALLLFICAEEERLELISRLRGLGREAATSRVARLLIRLNASQAGGQRDPGVRLPVSQVELGQLAGLSRIHVQRVIKALATAGGIAWRRGAVEIVDLERLRAATTSS